MLLQRKTQRMRTCRSQLKDDGRYRATPFPFIFIKLMVIFIFSRMTWSMNDDISDLRLTSFGQSASLVENDNVNLWCLLKCFSATANQDTICCSKSRSYHQCCRSCKTYAARTCNNEHAYSKFKWPDGCLNIVVSQIYLSLNERNDVRHPPTVFSSVSAGKAPLTPRHNHIIHVKMARVVTTGTKYDVTTSTIRSIGALFVWPWRTASMTCSSL